jgi:uncharacterized protein (DUF58 family)
MSRVVRVDEEALEVALQYGKNLSVGIMKMEEMLKKQEKARRDYTNIEEMIRRAVREELDMLTAARIGGEISSEQWCHGISRSCGTSDTV